MSLSIWGAAFWVGVLFVVIVHECPADELKPAEQAVMLIMLENWQQFKIHYDASKTAKKPMDRAGMNDVLDGNLFWSIYKASRPGATKDDFYDGLQAMDGFLGITYEILGTDNELLTPKRQGR